MPPRGRAVQSLLVAALWALGGAVAIAVTASEVRALWVKLSLEELVERSDLVVIGTLADVRAQSHARFDVGTMRIEEVLVGRKDLTEASLMIPAGAGGIRSSTDIFYSPGERGLWFLRRQQEGQEELYLADHPQRLQPIENVESVRAYLRSHR